MILPGARVYWNNPNNCQELEETWRALGFTPSISAVKEMFDDIPENERKTVLELGCGSGRIAELLDGYDAYIGVDQSRPMIELADSKFSDNPSVSFIISTLERCPVVESNVLLCIEVLQHHDEPSETLRKILHKYKFRHFIFTIMVSATPMFFGVGNGTGSRSVSFLEAERMCRGCTLQIVKDESGIEAWIVRLDRENPSVASPA